MPSIKFVLSAELKMELCIFHSRILELSVICQATACTVAACCLAKRGIHESAMLHYGMTMAQRRLSAPRSGALFIHASGSRLYAVNQMRHCGNCEARWFCRTSIEFGVPASVLTLGLFDATAAYLCSTSSPYNAIQFAVQQQHDSCYHNVRFNRRQTASRSSKGIRTRYLHAGIAIYRPHTPVTL
eukprot:6192678-Pleurochrysis_carterae.AAC.5